MHEPIHKPGVRTGNVVDSIAALDPMPHFAHISIEFTASKGLVKIDQESVDENRIAYHVDWYQSPENRQSAFTEQEVRDCDCASASWIDMARAQNDKRGQGT
jgi:hypothetical protein